MSVENHKDLIIQCRQIIIGHLSSCIGFFEQMDDALYRLANDALSEDQRKSYFFAMRQLHAHETNIVNELAQRVLEGYDAYWTTPVDFSTPALFKESDVKNEFTALHYRCTFLRGHAVPLNKHPLATETISHHFKLSLSPANLDTPIKMLAQDQFEKSMAIHCEQLYHSLNQHLIEQAILPDLNYPTAKPLKLKKPTAKKKVAPATPNGRRGTPTNLVKQLKIGDHLSRSDVEPHQRISFAWRSQLTGRYVFNGAEGQPVLDLNPAELKDWFKKKLLSPIAKST